MKEELFANFRELESERLGFVLEGTLRKHEMCRGNRYSDT